MPTCSVDGCDRDTTARGWCAGHYSRWKNHGDVLADRPLGEYRPRQPAHMSDDELASARIEPGTLSHLY